MSTFTCSCQFDSARNVIHVEANDWKEAQRKLRAIGLTATVDGELIADIAFLHPSWPTKLRRIVRRWRSCPVT